MKGRYLLQDRVRARVMGLDQVASLLWSVGVDFLSIMQREQ